MLMLKCNIHIAASYVHSIIYRQIDSATTTATDSFSTLDGNEVKLVVFEALSEVDPVLHIILHHTEVVQLGMVAGSRDLHERPRGTITYDHYICEAGESLQAALHEE